MENKIIEMDVRHDIENKQEPFQKIMEAVKDLQKSDVFLLHAPFEPVPLYAVMKAKGFDYQAEQLEKKHWKISFIKK
jgi:hypothetical protein